MVLQLYAVPAFNRNEDRGSGSPHMAGHRPKGRNDPYYEKPFADRGQLFRDRKAKDTNQQEGYSVDGRYDCHAGKPTGNAESRERLQGNSHRSADIHRHRRTRLHCSNYHVQHYQEYTRKGSRGRTRNRTVQRTLLPGHVRHRSNPAGDGTPNAENDTRPQQPCHDDGFI